MPARFWRAGRLLTLFASALALPAAAEMGAASRTYPHVFAAPGLPPVPAAENGLCRKDHSGLRLTAAESVADAETRLRAALSDGGALVVTKIDGLDCAYCASALEGAFAKRRDIAAAFVDPGRGAMFLVFSPGAAPDEGAIRKIVKRSGHEIVAIDQPAEISFAPAVLIGE